MLGAVGNEWLDDRLVLVRPSQGQSDALLFGVLFRELDRPFLGVIERVGIVFPFLGDADAGLRNHATYGGMIIVCAGQRMNQEG